MTEQYNDFVAAGVQLIALVRDTPQSASAYFEEHGIPFPCLADQDHHVYDRYEVKSRLLSLGQRPALFIIDREGIVRYAYLGWQQWEIPANEVVLEECRRTPCAEIVPD